MGLLWSLTDTVRGKVPGDTCLALGVPAMIPLEALHFRPLGKPITFHLMGGLPGPAV